MLRLPLGEVILGVFEGQEIEAEEGAGAQIRALDALVQSLTGGGNG
ncbi:hypothetical protein LG047_12475 [Methylocystis sp. WRRC1]|nr:MULTISPECIES: hypothetical protein [unclassified Methylocystis]MCC3246125.1 hypothetical protein [Methylocystis sp. WRRC1]